MSAFEGDVTFQKEGDGGTEAAGGGEAGEGLELRVAGCGADVGGGHCAEVKR